MALNVIFSDIRSERRARPVGNNVAPGTPLINGGQPAVTLTGSRDYAGNAISVTGNGETIVFGHLPLEPGETAFGTLKRLGRDYLAKHREEFMAIGQAIRNDDYATITFSGTYTFPVAGASTATEPGTLVYIETDGDLTLTEGTNTLFGRVEFWRGKDSATDTAVTIGA